MINLIKEKHKIDKWYFFIPIIGTIIYAFRIEYTVNKIVLEGNKEYKKIKKYRAFANLISFVISITLLILFLTLRNKHGFGAWPWFFWVGIGFAVLTNSVPYIPWYLFKKGIEDFEKVSK